MKRKGQPAAEEWPWLAVVTPTTVNLKIFYGGVENTVQRNKKSEKANACKVPWKSPRHRGAAFPTGS